MIDLVRIPPEQMPEFRRKQQERLLLTMRVSLFSGGLLSFGFIPWSRWHDPAGDLPTDQIHVSLGLYLITLGFVALLPWGQRYLNAIPVLASLGTSILTSYLLVTLPDGFLYGAGILLIVIVVTTMLSVDLPLSIALALLATLVAIPNIALFMSNAPFLTIMNTNWILVPAAVLSLGLALLFDQAQRRSFLLEKALEAERDRSSDLLHALLPTGFAERLMESNDMIADIVPDATVAFADLIGFTALSERLSAPELINMLTEIFTAMDSATARLGLEKIKTIGDAYMIGAGVADAKGCDARVVAEWAIESVLLVRSYASLTGQPLDVRVGIATGPLVSGVIGHRRPHFDLWGTTVNRASRLEDSAPAGSIHLDMSTAEQLRDLYQLGPRQTIDLYGIGEVQTCLLLGPSGANDRHDGAAASPDIVV